MVTKPGKHPEKSKQRFQNLICWKVHRSAQYFALCSHTMHELRSRMFLLARSSVSCKTIIVFCVRRARIKKVKKKKKQNNTTKNFIGFHSISRLLPDNGFRFEKKDKFFQNIIRGSVKSITNQRMIQ